MKVFVYFNLHKKCFSIKAMEGENKGRVIHHADRVLLRDVTPKVSEKGRQRVVRERKKNVHAGLVGDLMAWDWPEDAPDTPAKPDAWLWYNPYRVKTFVNPDTLNEFKSAGNAIIAREKGIRVYDAEFEQKTRQEVAA